MKYSALFSLIVPLGFAAACTQGSDQTASPTEPVVSQAKATPSVKLEEAAAPISTTCSAYQERLDAHQATLERVPGDEAAIEAVATYTSLIADACS